jgi:hypothetical protein
MHATDGGVHLHGQRSVAGLSTRRPGRGEDLAGYLVELATCEDRIERCPLIRDRDCLAAVILPSQGDPFDTPAITRAVPDR